MLLTAGSGIQNYSVRDNFFWLNSGWRILHGQIPHNDFSLATGTFVSYLAALGMLIRGPVSASTAAGQAAFGIFMGCISFLVLRRRTTPMLAAFGAIFCGLLIMAARQAGEAYHLHSHAFLYNRIAEGLLAPFVWLTLMLPRAQNARLNLLEGLIAGGLLVLLIFTKFTYGMVGVALLFLALLTERLRLRDLSTILVGALLCGIAISCVAGVSPAAWWDDIGRPFRIGYEGTQLKRLFAGIVKGLPALVALGILGGMAFNYLSSRGRRLLFIAIAGCWALAVFITIASQQRQEYLLPISAALILTDAFFRRTAPRSPRRIISLTLLILLAIPAVIPDARSIALSWRSARESTLPQLKIAAPGLADFYLGHGLTGFANELNEGLALASQVPTNTPVLAVDYSDVISFAQHRPPAEGGVIFWYPGFSYATNTYPAPDVVFRGIPWLLMTKRPKERDLFIEIYGKHLSNLYEHADESSGFDLWKPRAAP